MSTRSQSRIAQRKGKPSADTLDPATEAHRFLATHCTDGRPHLITWGNEFYGHSEGCYRVLPAREVRDRLIKYLNKRFAFVTTSATNHVLDQVRALAMVPAAIQPPCWLDPREDDWDPRRVFAARNGLVNVELLTLGDGCIIPHTPRYFTRTALDFDVDPSAPPPAGWLRFLDELWPEDQESIDALQELFGYLIVGGTWLQKIFAFIGPPRSGKGTIARVMRALIGMQNCCGPTLASLGTNFGLWPLLSKSLATISDARLSGRTDQAVVVERLLSISGEDAITIDRKNLEPLTTTLATRIVLLTNELPRLGDDSGAMAKRLILWRFTQSFYGQENPNLTAELLPELPSILLWSMEGWRRLTGSRHMIQPASGRDMIADIEDLGSPVSAFVREMCILDPEACTAVAPLFEAWKRWCDAKGNHSGNEAGFGRNLSAAFPALGRSQPRDEQGGRYRAYVGIGLREYETGGY